MNPFLKKLEEIQKLAIQNESNEQEKKPWPAKQTECSICGDTELIPIREENGLPVYGPCECKAQKNIKRLIRSSALTEEMQNWTFDNYKESPNTKNLFDTAKDYAFNFDQVKNTRGNGFGFTGPVGVGKTHLMSAIANYLIAKGVPTIYVNTTPLLYELRQAEFHRDGNLEDIDQKIYTLQNAELVLFDDLAKEKSTEWTQTQYYRIIEHRYTNHKPTGFTTNCDLSQLAEKIGDATTSRLVQMCGGIAGRIVEVPRHTEDYRFR